MGSLPGLFFSFFGYAGLSVISYANWFRVVSFCSFVFIISAFIFGIVIRPSLFIFAKKVSWIARSKRRMVIVRSWVGSSLNSHLMIVGIDIRFPLPMDALKLTERVSGISLSQPKLTLLNQI